MTHEQHKTLREYLKSEIAAALLDAPQLAKAKREIAEGKRMSPFDKKVISVRLGRDQHGIETQIETDEDGNETTYYVGVSNCLKSMEKLGKLRDRKLIEGPNGPMLTNSTNPGAVIELTAPADAMPPNPAGWKRGKKRK